MTHHHHIVTYYLHLAAQARACATTPRHLIAAPEGYYLGLAFLYSDFAQ